MDPSLARALQIPLDLLLAGEYEDYEQTLIGDQNARGKA